MTRPGIKPRSPGPLMNTLTIMPGKLKLNEYISFLYYVKLQFNPKFLRASTYSGLGPNPVKNSGN